MEDMVYFVIMREYKGRRCADVIGIRCDGGRPFTRFDLRDAKNIYPFTDWDVAEKIAEKLNNQFAREGILGDRDNESNKDLVARTDVCRGEDGCPRVFVLRSYGSTCSVQLYPDITARGDLPDNYEKLFSTKEEAYKHIESERARLVKVGFKKEDVDAVMVYEGSVEEYRELYNRSSNKKDNGLARSQAHHH